MMKMPVLDKGYVSLVETWGSDERIIESARMSTAKGFLGWGQWVCSRCKGEDSLGQKEYSEITYCPYCSSQGSMAKVVGDEKLLKYLWDHQHATPFEMAGLTIEVKAPIFVFREWHRHRVPFGYNEMSARYVPLPDENYVPSVDRLMSNSKTNKQAGTAAGADELTEARARFWVDGLESLYKHAQDLYELGLKYGVPKELARLPVPVARYSCMRATGNLRGWLGFLKLRCASGAQWEIRQYANAVAGLVQEHFPRTHEVARESLGLP